MHASFSSSATNDDNEPPVEDLPKNLCLLPCMHHNAQEYTSENLKFTVGVKLPDAPRVKGCRVAQGHFGGHVLYFS